MTCRYVFLFSYGISILDTKNFGLEQFQITRKKCRVARDVLLRVVVSLDVRFIDKRDDCGKSSIHFFILMHVCIRTSGYLRE